MSLPTGLLELRARDYQRHLMDLRTDSYHGAHHRSDREQVFNQAVHLLDPVVDDVLERFNEVMLDGAGTIQGPIDGSGENREVRRQLSWPQQQAAKHRLEPGKTVRPITIRAHFYDGWTHGHLAGSDAGDWPFQVTTEADARRQWIILWAIAEVELHHRIFESYHPWEVVPLPTGDSPPAAKWG